MVQNFFKWESINQKHMRGREGWREKERRKKEKRKGRKKEKDHHVINEALSPRSSLC